MNFSRKIILLAAVTPAISLGTACSFFDAAPEALCCSFPATRGNPLWTR